VRAKIGRIPELVRDLEETGLTYSTGDMKDLEEKNNLMLNNSDKIPSMGKNVRAYVEQELNSEAHYHKLMQIYNQAAERSALR
jgi:hypothetical protein